MNAIVGSHDVVFMVLDALRYDVATDAMARGETPSFERLIGSWERRLTPACFTYAAHHAFFAGFLPVPHEPGIHPRPFACAFEGSQTIHQNTHVFDAPDIVSGFASAGYRTVCIGGVGFFNLATPLGRVLPAFFQESHFDRCFGVTDPKCAENVFELAARILDESREEQRVFLYVNVAAIHQPNYFYAEGRSSDDLGTHRAALRYVDRCVPVLEAAIRRRPRVFGIVCSDHGTAYGEDGYIGHRAPHPIVNTVPYAEAEWHNP
ncbi:MAG: STM4013/SEN3800 family hydrolase [Polyangiaceae bacterium]|nr:STM4013/SEN3800 family hydrolase [Polyangiaceae bacterium]